MFNDFGWPSFNNQSVNIGDGFLVSGGVIFILLNERLKNATKLSVFLVLLVFRISQLFLVSIRA